VTATPPAGLFRVLGAGARATRRNLSLWLFGLGLDSGRAAVRMALSVLALAMASDGFLRGAASAGEGAALAQFLGHGLEGAFSDRIVFPVIGLIVTVEILCAVLEAFYLGAAVEGLTQAARSDGPLPPGLVARGAAAFARATLASLWLALIELGAGLARWVVLGGSFLVLSTAFRQHQHGWRAAAIAGLGAGLLGVAGLALSLFARAYLVRAVRGPGSTLGAAADAVDVLRARALTFGGLVIAQGVLSIGVAALASAPGVAAAGAGAEHVGLQLAFRLFGAAITGALSAGADLLILGAVCAIDLDVHGELPAPPAPPAPKSRPAEPVLEAQEVLVAQVVAPLPSEPTS
jgi:hypothetical protein